MINKELMSQIKWLVVALLLISLVLVTVLEGTVLQRIQREIRS
jgi:hypothetical protein